MKATKPLGPRERNHSMEGSYDYYTPLSFFLQGHIKLWSFRVNHQTLKMVWSLWAVSILKYFFTFGSPLQLAFLPNIRTIFLKYSASSLCKHNWLTTLCTADFIMLLVHQELIKPHRTLPPSLSKKDCKSATYLWETKYWVLLTPLVEIGNHLFQSSSQLNGLINQGWAFD